MWIHYPLFFIVFLLCFLWLFTTIRRVYAFKENIISASTIAFVNKEEIPITTRLAGNSYDNNFQQPILFIILLLSLHQYNLSDMTWYMLSVTFVFCRYWHSIEHILNRRLLSRTIAFILSACCLFIGWFRFIYLLSLNP